MIGPRQSLPLAALTLTLATASPSAADITPADVWGAFLSQMTATGYAVTEEQLTDTADTLVLGDVAFELDMAEGGTTVLTMRGMQYRADGAGGVTGDFSGMVMIMDVRVPDSEPFTAEMAFSAPGQVVHFTGDPGDIEATFDWPTATLALTGLTVEGEALDATAAFTMTNAAGRYRYVGEGAAVAMTNEMTAARVDFESDATIHEEDETVRWSMTGTLADLAISGTGQNANLLLSGLAAAEGTSRIAYGPGSLNFGGVSEKGEVAFDISFTGGFADTDLSQGRLGYATGTSGIEVSAGGNVLPFSGPVLRIATTGNSLDMPLQASEELQDFALTVNVSGVELGGQVWVMLDPAGMLSHDPADIVLDLSGSGVVSQDLTKLAETPEAMSAPPGELRSMLLRSLLVRALGAEVSGEGAADFAPGSPIPTGAVDLRGNGVATVLQRLAELGWLDPMSAGMAQMMLTAYTVPADEPDTWTSRIEISPSTGLLVNGQPMQ